MDMKAIGAYALMGTGALLMCALVGTAICWVWAHWRAEQVHLHDQYYVVTPIAHVPYFIGTTVLALMLTATGVYVWHVDRTNSSETSLGATEVSNEQNEEQ
jgi:hypothetical protein